LNTSNSHEMLPHEEVVAGFNLLGYRATFAAVAAELDGVSAPDLYDLYPSREALAEAWLAGAILQCGEALSVRSLLTGLVYGLIEPLQRQRDFARAWIEAAPRSGPLNLPVMASLHQLLLEYFSAGLRGLRDKIALPPLLALEDALDELSEALTLISTALVLGWALDRSEQGARTCEAVESSALLVDALLTRRADFGGTSLLVHLGRAGRFGNGESLVQALRQLLPPHAPGPR
jgi:AcrR family transcriptional regulator